MNPDMAITEGEGSRKGMNPRMNWSVVTIPLPPAADLSNNMVLV